jgi:hypothetical protein
MKHAQTEPAGSPPVCGGEGLVRLAVMITPLRASEAVAVQLFSIFRMALRLAPTIGERRPD